MWSTNVQKQEFPRAREAGIQLNIDIQRFLQCNLITTSEVTDPSLKEVILDRPLHQVTPSTTSCNTLILLNSLGIHPLQRRQVRHLQEHLVGQGLSVIALEPVASKFVRRESLRYVANLELQQLREVLLARRGSSEVAS